MIRFIEHRAIGKSLVINEVTDKPAGTCAMDAYFQGQVAQFIECHVSKCLDWTAT